MPPRIPAWSTTINSQPGSVVQELGWSGSCGCTRPGWDGQSNITANVAVHWPSAHWAWAFDCLLNPSNPPCCGCMRVHRADGRHGHETDEVARAIEMGAKLVSRNSYERAAVSAWDAPLSSRFDEDDAVAVFDRVFVPWEDVLVCRDVRKATGFYAQSGFMPRYTLQSGTRLAVKLEFLGGLLTRGLEANGTIGYRGVQAKLGELIGWCSLIWAITSALCHDTQEGPGDSIVPALEYATLIRLFGTQAFPNARDIFIELLGGAPLVTPSSNRDLLDDDLRPTFDRFYRGSTGEAHDRVRLFKLIWDAVDSEFGGRHAVRGQLRGQPGPDATSHPEVRQDPRARGPVRRPGQDPDTKVYTAGQALLTIGLAAVGSLDVRRLARPELEVLAAELGETVHLACLDGDKVLFLDTVESPRPVRVTDRTCVTLPAYSASGKVLLAELAPDVLHGLLPEVLPAVTHRTCTSRDELERELAEIRRTGFAVNLRERTRTVRRRGRRPAIQWYERPGADRVGALGAHQRRRDRADGDRYLRRGDTGRLPPDAWVT